MIVVPEILTPVIPAFPFVVAAPFFTTAALDVTYGFLKSANAVAAAVGILSPPLSLHFKAPVSYTHLTLPTKA